jgi:hypothetical protein
MQFIVSLKCYLFSGSRLSLRPKHVACVDGTDNKIDHWQNKASFLYETTQLDTFYKINIYLNSPVSVVSEVQAFLLLRDSVTLHCFLSIKEYFKNNIKVGSISFHSSIKYSHILGKVQNCKPYTHYFRHIPRS